jgi:hypothetical protein
MQMQLNRDKKGGIIITAIFFPKRFLMAAVVIALVSSLFAEQETPAPDPEPGKTMLSGFTAFEVGQFEHARYIKDMMGIDHNWIESGYLHLSFNSFINEHLSVRGTVEARVGYQTSPLDEIFDPTQAPPSKIIYWTIPNAEGILSFGKKEVPVTIGVGLFEYKYNPEAQNLGEYLFRTGTYPAFINTSFDLPLARLGGIVASCKINDFLRQDLLLTTLGDMQPYNDFSLTYVADASIGPALDVGAAVQFANLISVMSDQTSVRSYYGNGYLTAPGDTGFYTFKGTKLMARIMFDPKRLFTESLLGKEDCKLYVEAAILGLESYPASNTIDISNPSNPIGYDHLNQKIPVMMGFNIPTFNILDRAALEAEWYGCRYPISNRMVIVNGYAAPSGPSNDGYTWEDYRKDDWKLSINVEKTLFKKFSLIIQAARDHSKLETTIKKDQDYDDVLVRPKHWYWMGKMKFNF